MTEAEMERIVDQRLAAFKVLLMQELRSAAVKPKPSFKIARRIIYNSDVTDIIDDVCEKYGYSYEDLKSSGQKAHLAAARAIAIKRIHNLGVMSSVSLGRIFDRNHTTILHAIGRDISKINWILANPNGTKKECERALA